MIRVAVDTGGTFTDCLVVLPRAGRPPGEADVRRAKVLSSGWIRATCRSVSARELTVDWNLAPRRGFFRGAAVRGLGSHAAGVIADSDPAGRLTLVAEAPFVAGETVEIGSGLEAPLLAARVALDVPLVDNLPPVEFRLATTKGTNALLERRGAAVVFFVTAGFEDLLDIGTQQRPDLFALAPEKARPWIARACAVEERVAADGAIVRALDEDALRVAARGARDAGFDCAAVALLHADRHPRHERRVGELLDRCGFRFVSLSSDIAPFRRLVPRAQTTVVDAYLQPLLSAYLERVGKGLGEGSSARVLTSWGGLASPRQFRGAHSLVSGPAGGVLGAIEAAASAGFARLLGLDMGGTSTDVCRADGRPTYRFSSRVGDAEILVPSVALETVAAGGGSIVRLDGARLVVGPESAGAAPGPAAYGAGGPLTLTDANLLLGRLPADRFAVPLDLAAAHRAALALAQTAARFVTRGESAKGAARGADADAAVQDLLLDAVAIADERTADALKEVSVREGHDPADHVMVAFGGAAGQHACAIADLIGVRTILAPVDASLLSARGLAGARRERFAERQILRPLPEVGPGLAELWRELDEEARAALGAEGVFEDAFDEPRRLLRVRLLGHEAALDLVADGVCLRDAAAVEARFASAYRDLFGDTPPEREREVESARVIVGERIASGAGGVGGVPRENLEPALDGGASSPLSARVATAEGWIEARRHDRMHLEIGEVHAGPALIVEAFTSWWVAPGWSFRRLGDGAVLLERGPEPAR
jgi:5-oxoprolinase (ATP-hydrolysing)